MSYSILLQVNGNIQLLRLKKMTSEINCPVSVTFCFTFHVSKTVGSRTCNLLGIGQLSLPHHHFHSKQHCLSVFWTLGSSLNLLSSFFLLLAVFPLWLVKCYYAISLSVIYSSDFLSYSVYPKSLLFQRHYIMSPDFCIYSLFSSSSPTQQFNHTISKSLHELFILS